LKQDRGLEPRGGGREREGGASERSTPAITARQGRGVERAKRSFCKPYFIPSQFIEPDVNVMGGRLHAL